MLKKIDNKQIIEACKNNSTMSQAAASLKIHFNTFKRRAQQLKCYKPNQGSRGNSKKRKYEYSLKDILSGLHPHYQTFKLKKRLFKEGLKEEKCESCGLTEWLDKELVLELHHIDGDSRNHKLNNLMILCPNCHSQTKTFRAKKLVL